MSLPNQVPANRRRLYLMRHGEVSYFDADGNPYQPSTVPLNSEGRHQAEAAARELAGVPFDRVISSTLLRSRETAAIVARGRSILPQEFAELCEIQPGRLADIPATALQAAFLGAFGSEVGRDTRFLAGETFGALEDRVRGCFTHLMADPSWRHLLMVAHGGVNRVILAHVLGSGLRGISALEQDAACLNIIDVDDDGRWLVRLVNHTPYNAAKIGLDLTTMERLYRQYRPAAPGGH